MYSKAGEAWIFAQCTQKCASVVSVFPWGQFARGSILPLFIQKQNIFQWADDY